MIHPLPHLHMRARTALTIGVLGTASAVGTYLYNRPALRKKMLGAENAQDALELLKEEAQKDAADVASSIKKAAVHNWLTEEMSKTGKKLGKRFYRAGKHAKAAKNELVGAKSDVEHNAKKLQKKAADSVEKVKEATKEATAA